MRIRTAYSLPIKGLLTGLLLFTAFRLAATEETFYGALLGSEIAVGSVLEVSDTFPSGGVVQHISVQDLIWFSINEESLIKPSSNFEVRVTLSIAKYDSTNTLVSTESGVVFTTRFDTAYGASYPFGYIYKFADFHRLKITVTGLYYSLAATPSNPGASFPAFMRLESRITINRKYFFDCNTSPVLTNYAIDTAKNCLVAGWQYQMGAEEYDLEWTFYDTLSPTIAQANAAHSDFNFVFLRNATRITTPFTTYNIPLTYPAGWLYLRVRSIQYDDEGKRQYGRWSSYKGSSTTLNGSQESYEVPWHERKLNWQVMTVYAEEGKRSQSVTYFDGSLRNRQTVAKSDASQVIIASETLYDRQGRPAIQVMPAPISTGVFGVGTPTWSEKIRYVKNYSAAAGASIYTAADFDDATVCPSSSNPAEAMDTTNSMVGRYFSSNNPWRNKIFHNNIPDSYGYPYAVTEYSPDQTGRVQRQGGLGPAFQLGSGHETRYYYAKPDQTELDQLFGVEAGYAEHYQKNMVVDPNGQVSVSYVDAHGRTVATALAGEVPSAYTQLSNIATADSVTSNLLTNVESGAALVSTYSWPVSSYGIRTVTYRAGPELELSIEDCLPAERCYDCLYDLQIVITDACGRHYGDSPYSWKNYTVGEYDSICDMLTSTLHQHALTDTFDVGIYFVTKTLRVSQDALNYYADDYVSHLDCLPGLETLTSSFVGDTLCGLTCTDCLARLEGFEGRFLANIETPTDADSTMAHQLYLQARLECEGACDVGGSTDCELMYQLMLIDISPGGQYGLYSESYSADSVLIYGDSDDPTSIFYNGGSGYPYADSEIGVYLDEYGLPDSIYFAELDTTLSPRELSIDQFIRYFKPSWAKTLVQLHPEYCQYLCCGELTNPHLDSLLNAINSYTDAVSAGLWPLEDLLAQDPLINQFPDLTVTITSYIGTYATTSPNSCGNPVSLIEIISSVVYCGGVFPCDVDPGEGCDAENDLFWTIFAGQYQTFTAYLKALKMQGDACATDFPDCDFICVGSSGCGDYTDKISRIPALTKLPNVYDLQGELDGMVDSLNSALMTHCDSLCDGTANVWIGILDQSCTTIREADASDRDDLLEYFTALCVAGCDIEHPFGTVEVEPPVLSVFGHANIQDAITAVFPSLTVCDPGCSGELITFPGSIDAVQYLAPPLLVRKPDTCVCARIDFLLNCAETTGQGSLLSMIDSTSNVHITADELNMLITFCDTSCQIMPFTVSLPPLLQCDVCKDYATVSAAWEEYVDGSCIGGTVSTEEEPLVAAHLNRLLGLNRTYDDYEVFISNTDAEEHPNCYFMCPLSLFEPKAPDTFCVSPEAEAGAGLMAELALENLKDSLRQEFVRKYVEKCLGPDLHETFEAKGLQREYQYTLYYYDQAGNLVKTVAPSGVTRITNLTTLAQIKSHRDAGAGSFVSGDYPTHTFVTRYWYNTLNQVVRDSTPDRNTTHYWYDLLGRLVLSQNARQKTASDYTYTRYDELGRAIETGRAHRNISLTFGYDKVWHQAHFETWLEDSTTRYEVTRSYYDDLIPNISSTQLPGYFGSSGQQNLRNRIASVTYEDTWDGVDTTYNSATHYSYDIAGNVSRIVQDVPELVAVHQRYKRVEYDYDQISGKVNYVYYQRDSLDQFMHHYVYDADNRLQFAETSPNGLLWERDANYEYYLHGPLVRTELGERRVQGLDYAYTLQGWLKGVNSGAIMLNSTVTGNFATVDMGRDGKSGNTGDWARNKNVARDVVGFTLNYYNSDYRRIGNIGSDNTNFEMKYSGSLFAAASPSLYNGNIRHAVYSVGKLNLGSGGIIKPEGYAYKYDQLNRLVRMRATGTNSYTVSSGSQSWSTTNGMVALFQETAAYDPNGNITNYVRYGNLGGSNTRMDSLVYYYASNDNRLTYIDDLQTVAGRYSSDLDDQSSGNYNYDATGNLTQDVKEGINSGGITWTNAQKLASVTKTNQLLNFRYDAMQQRLWKANRNTSNNTEKRTYYIRDAQGNVLATYTAWLRNAHLSTPTWDSIQFNERHIYGSSRLGMLQQNLRLWPSPPDNDVNHPDSTGRGYMYEGLKRYEITNHLGNVLVVITDRKRGLATSGTTIQWYEADILSSQNYYPFGMLMPGRTFSNPNVNSGYDYRYGFNGKEGDDEVKGDDNQQDYGMRIYDLRVGRFLSVDPLAREYPWFTPYQFAGNMPIWAIDLDGEEPDPFFNTTQYQNQGIGYAIQVVLDQYYIEELTQSLASNNIYPGWNTIFEPKNGSGIYILEIQFYQGYSIKSPNISSHIYGLVRKPYRNLSLLPVNLTPVESLNRNIPLPAIKPYLVEEIKIRKAKPTRNIVNVVSESASKLPPIYEPKSIKFIGNTNKFANNHDANTEISRIAQNLIKNPGSTVTIYGNVNNDGTINSGSGPNIWEQFSVNDEYINVDRGPTEPPILKNQPVGVLMDIRAERVRNVLIYQYNISPDRIETSRGRVSSTNSNSNMETTFKFKYKK